MSDFQDTLSKILSSPEDMQKIASMAESLGLMGGASEQGTDLGAEGSEQGTDPRAHPGASGAPAAVPVMGPGMGPSPVSTPNPLAGLDPELMGRIMKLIGAYNGGSDKLVLIEALSPYIQSSQKGKLARAAQAAKLARAARSALDEFR